MTKTVAIIPARWASSRFPGKPLALLRGKPMIQLVYQRCQLIEGLDSVHVATDNEEILNVVEGFGGSAFLTSPYHRSGTDRLAEACLLLGLNGDDLVVNVQADQPAVNPAHPALLAQALQEDPSLGMTTLAVPLLDPTEIKDPNHVKVVFDENYRALYFSRAPIPWPRDGGPGLYYKHVGLYAYTVKLLRLFVSWSPGRLEELEKLEQLRVLERGQSIKIILAEGLSPEVDVPEDISKAEALLAQDLK
ncbi:MAG: 3-deoxy-manno-octulosonate cytidylyltransferase [Deltaproteobacteria bacterium]|jgi:3-deoxy-manno-octulosonate cytidylyltransferase (CMP-KDO synthetase)|nr:3-deoxy-manno-octulosonate cytidylyltransferase [Deltaproteobacteria bacterium]